MRPASRLSPSPLSYQAYLLRPRPLPPARMPTRSLRMSPIWWTRLLRRCRMCWIERTW